MMPAAAQTLPPHDPAYIPALQCLRGIAAMAVVIAHITYAQHQLFPNYTALLPEIISFWGVDLFFVISGFIIAYITANTLASATNAKIFLLSRLIRVVPAYWFYTLLSVVFTVYVGSGHIKFKELWQSLLFIKPGFPLLIVGWTLTYEMLFYLVYSVCLIFLNHKQRIWAVAIVLIALVSIRTLGNISNVYIKFYSNPILLEFIAGLLIGSRLSIGSLPVATMRNRWLPLLSLISGIIALCLLSATLELELLIKFRVLLWGLPAALIVWGALNILRTTRSAFLERLGNISYSIYLVHVPITGVVAILLRQVMDPSINPTLLHCALSILATIALAGVSYTFIEQATSRWLKRVLCIR